MFWWGRGHLAEAARWAEEILQAAALPWLTEARVRTVAGLAAFKQGAYELADAFLTHARALFHELGDAHGAPRAAVLLGFGARRSFAMAESWRKPAKQDTQQYAKSTAGKPSNGFTEEERAAVRERAHELKAAARRGPRAGELDGESDVLARIAEMPEPDRAMAERLHAIIKASAPALSPRTWYGMPAYAKDGKVVCFFQGAQKFNTRYAILGFSDEANLDNGAMWPTSFALKELTAAEETRIVALVKEALS